MATLRPRIDTDSIHPDAMTGRVLCQLREQLGMSQSQLAPILGLTRSSLGNRERRNSAVPVTVAAGLRAIQAAQAAGEISNLPRSPKTTAWRESTAFKQTPPFEVLPPNVTTCGCDDPKCRLTPVRDGDWPGREHLWIFHGQRCLKRVYLDATGRKVLSPRRVVAEVCAACGRVPGLGPKDSKLLGERIWTRRCRPRPGDSLSLRHDPPTYWWKRNGKLERLPQDAVEEMHGRSQHSFPVPKCDLVGCPGNGQKMHSSAVLKLSTKNGGIVTIQMYRCRVAKPHSAYRILPLGEIATRLSMGRYRWTESVAGNSVDTAPRKRFISPSRLMPESNCPQCRASLRKIFGPRNVQGGHRKWTAKCSNCDRVFYVRNDGQIDLSKGSRWRKAQGGRPSKAELFTKAEVLFLYGRSWPQCAELLIPDEAKENRHAAAERLRVGVAGLKKKRKTEKMNP
jgi:hypothetical protein